MNNLNTTGGYVNTADGTVTAFTSASTLAPEMKTYYDTELLANARPEMVHAQFGRQQTIPQGRGKVIEWRKFNTLENAGQLTEGVIPDGQKLGVSSITDEVAQYGTYVSVSDQLELTAVDPVILEANTELAASAGRTRDELIRNDIVSGTSVLYARRNGTADVTSRAGLDATCKLTADTINRAATFLKKNHAPTIDGCYVAIIHPSVAYDLRSDPAWLDAHKYAGPHEIYDGEIGKLHGVRFVETTQAKVIRGADLASDSRTLTVNHSGGYSGAITSLAFDGGTVAASALVGRRIMVGGVTATVTANTASTITFASTDFGTVADNAVIYPGEGGENGLAVYCTLILGKDAYGTVDVSGGGLEMIVHPRHEAGGPLDQFSTIGYKLMTNGARILYEDRMVRVESCGAYSATDEEN